MNRIRRTNEAIDRDIENAVRSLAKEIGFPNMTVTGIAKEARIEPNVFYKRYKDLDDLIDKFIEEYGKWLRRPSRYALNPDSFVKIFIDLAESIYDDKILQRILLWQLGLEKDSESAKKVEYRRDINSEKFFETYKDCIDKDELEFRSLTAFIQGGIYYMVMQKDLSPLCRIDFSTQEGKRLLLASINNIVRKMLPFKSESQHTEIVEIARKLKQENVENDIISRSTGLCKKEIENL